MSTGSVDRSADIFVATMLAGPAAIAKSAGAAVVAEPFRPVKMQRPAGSAGGSTSLE